MVSDGNVKCICFEILFFYCDQPGKYRRLVANSVHKAYCKVIRWQKTRNILSVPLLPYRKCLEPLPALLGEKVYIRQVFLRKFNFGHLLFDTFFNIIGTFNGIHPQSKPIFPLQYVTIIILKASKCSALPISTPEEDKDVRSLTFL